MWWLPWASKTGCCLFFSSTYEIYMGHACFFSLFIIRIIKRIWRARCWSYNACMICCIETTRRTAINIFCFPFSFSLEKKITAQVKGIKKINRTDGIGHSNQFNPIHTISTLPSLVSNMHTMILILFQKQSSNKTNITCIFIIAVFNILNRSFFIHCDVSRKIENFCRKRVRRRFSLSLCYTNEVHG